MSNDPGQGPFFSQPSLQILENIKKAFQVIASVGEEAFELCVALLVMIIVERAYTEQGLGIYAYLMACLYAVRYLTNFGVSRYVEREIAATDNSSRQQRIIARGWQTVVITGLAGALLLLISAKFDTSHTRIQERLAAYFIIAFILPLANLNSLKLSILQGQGKHGRVARLRMMRHGIILGGVFFLSRLNIPPSFLLIAFLLAEVMVAGRVQRHLKLPKIWKVFKSPKSTLETLKKGQAYLFTDNSLDLLLNIDLFVLGLFVSAVELGIYAEAAVLVRFFLIIPVGIKPILRRMYTMAVSENHMNRLAMTINRNTALLFSIHTVLALLILLYFPVILNFFFETRISAARSFEIFIIFVPGLIFYGPLSAQEPIYEALDQAQALRRFTLLVAAANLILTFYLVPAAGLSGAATATVLTMLLYTGLFGRRLTITRAVDKRTLLVAGMGFYLTYNCLDWIAWNPFITFFIAPIMLVALFYVCGVYGVRSLEPNHESASPLP